MLDQNTKNQSMHFEAYFKVVLVYIIIATTWLLLSEPLIGDAKKHPVFAIILRIAYIIFSALILLFVLRQGKVLRETRGEYHQLVDTLLEPIIIHTGGYIIGVNQLALELFGATCKQDLMGKSVFNLVHPDYRDVVKQRMTNLRDGKPTGLLEEKFITLQGEIRNVEVVGVPIMYRGRPATQVLIRDITRRKQAEKNLKEVVQRFQVIEKNMSDFIVLLSIDGTVEYMSPSHHNMLGRALNINEGKFDPKYVHPEDLPRLKASFSKLNKFRSVFRVQHKEGTWLTVEIIGAPLVDENREMSSMVLTFRDITERQQTEELLRRSDKLAAVGELAAGVAHEIRNPLTAINGFIKLLQRNAQNDEIWYFDVIHNELNRIQTVSNELLLLAKPRTAEMRGRNIHIIIRDVISLMESHALLYNVEISMSFQTCVPMVKCDENQVKQVFINVIKNAFEAMPQGGNLIIMVNYDEQLVCMKFIDEGQGITPEQLKHIGKPFFSTKEGGTGLGITICQKIIENHGGTMTIESEVNMGATVSIRLPIYVPN